MKLRRKFMLIIRLLMCAQLFFFSVDNFMRQYISINLNASSTDSNKLVFAVIYAVLHAQSMTSLWFNQDFLRKLFLDTLYRK